MGEITNIETWRQLLANSFGALGERVAGFLPSLIAALVILIVGWLISKLLAALTQKGLARLGLDRAAAQLQLGQTLRRAGIEAPPSRIGGLIVFWLVMLTFLLSAVETLGISGVALAIDRLFAYLPRVIGALLIVLLGVLLGGFVRGVVASGAAAAELDGASRLGALAYALVVAVSMIVAAEQLGVATEILVTVLATLIAGVTLTAGVAFALGARPVVTHILAGHYLRQSLPPGTSIEIAGERGNVERIGPVDTLLRNEQQSWSIPNARLLEEVVKR